MYKGTTKSENVAAFRLKKRVEHKPIDSESEFRFKYFRDINFKPRNCRKSWGGGQFTRIA